MSKVRDMLLHQKSELSRRIMPLTMELDRMRKDMIEKLTLIEELKKELEQVHSALKAVEKSEAGSQITIMQAVLNVLSDRPDGMTALEILSEINTRYFGGQMKRTSLSPQLSRLKDRDRKIELRGNRWFRLSDEPTLFSPKE